MTVILNCSRRVLTVLYPPAHLAPTSFYLDSAWSEDFKFVNVGCNLKYVNVSGIDLFLVYLKSLIVSP